MGKLKLIGVIRNQNQSLSGVALADNETHSTEYVPVSLFVAKVKQGEVTGWRLIEGIAMEEVTLFGETQLIPANYTFTTKPSISLYEIQLLNRGDSTKYCVYSIHRYTNRCVHGVVYFSNYEQLKMFARALGIDVDTDKVKGCSMVLNFKTSEIDKLLRLRELTGFNVAYNMSYFVRLVDIAHHIAKTTDGETKLLAPPEKVRELGMAFEALNRKVE